MKLPEGVHVTVNDDPPLLKHIQVTGPDNRSAYTSIGTKDNVDDATAKLISTLLHLPQGVCPSSSMAKMAEGSELERKRAARRAQRLARKLRRQQHASI